MRLLVLDNYDSFTWNLVHYLQVAGAEVLVRRNDAVSAAEALSGVDAAVISPGPGAPDEAGISLDLVRECAARGVPLLGVCLGHQAIARAFGGRIGLAARPMHGKTSPILHDRRGLFDGLPSPFVATRYHSLAVEEDGLADALRVSARSDDGTVMGLEHADLPIHGVQFHPESVASEHGHRLIRTFLALAKAAVRNRA